VSASAVLALFLTPVIAVELQDEPARILRISAWLYVAVFVLLGFSWIARRKRDKAYVTVGMSIMNLCPVRVGSRLRLISGDLIPATKTEKRGRAAARVALMVILAAVVFLILEVMAYA
jgi:hypothetical protein